MTDDYAFSFGDNSAEDTWNHMAMNVIEVQLNMKTAYFRFAPHIVPPNYKVFLTFDEYDRRWYTAEQMTDR